MRPRPIHILVAALVALILGACGSLRLGVQTSTAEPTPLAKPEQTSRAPLELPKSLLAAREAALAHLRSQFGGVAPPAGLDWQAERTTPQGLLGSEVYEFTTPDWTLTIQYPVMASENTIYTIQVFGQAEAFKWEGRLDAAGKIMADEAPPEPGLAVTGWLGHVIGLPDGSPYDDYLSLSPDGAGEFGLVGADAALEAEIVALRDKPEPGKYANFWGTLTCGVEDYNGCRLVVDRLRHGATATSPEPVVGWIGTLTTTTFNSGLSYVLILAGDNPVWHSIHSNDPEVLAQLDNLAGSGARVSVWGEFTTGVPDVNGTRIQASRLEVMSPVGEQPAPVETALKPPAGWEPFASMVYDYRFWHPPQAEIHLHGPEGFPSEDLPAGRTADEYLDQLQETLTDELCVEIRYALGVIYIAAPPNQEKFYTPCGRTGVGAGELIELRENLAMDAGIVQAEGFEFLGGGETLDLHQEWFLITLPNGTRIQFGSLPDASATYQDYLTSTKEVLKQILGTLEINE